MLGLSSICLMSVNNSFSLSKNSTREIYFSRVICLCNAKSTKSLFSRFFYEVYDHNFSDDSKTLTYLYRDGMQVSLGTYKFQKE